jgi:hypothetical protein
MRRIREVLRLRAELGSNLSAIACSATIRTRNPVASFKLLPTGVASAGRRWDRSAWRHETSWWLR